MSLHEDVVVESYRLDLTMSQCGYPLCCPGDQPKFVPNPFPSQAAQAADVQLGTFFSESEEIFHETGMPMFPCMLHHFCLPFRYKQRGSNLSKSTLNVIYSPICAMMYCANKRKSRLEELIKEWNETHGLHKGLYLQWNADAMAILSGRKQT